MPKHDLDTNRDLLDDVTLHSIFLSQHKNDAVTEIYFYCIALAESGNRRPNCGCTRLSITLGGAATLCNRGLLFSWVRRVSKFYVHSNSNLHGLDVSLSSTYTLIVTCVIEVYSSHGLDVSLSSTYTLIVTCVIEVYSSHGLDVSLSSTYTLIVTCVIEVYSSHGLDVSLSSTYTLIVTCVIEVYYSHGFDVSLSTTYTLIVSSCWHTGLIGNFLPLCSPPPPSSSLSSLSLTVFLLIEASLTSFWNSCSRSTLSEVRSPPSWSFCFSWRRERSIIRAVCLITRRWAFFSSLVGGVWRGGRGEA